MKKVTKKIKNQRTLPTGKTASFSRWSLAKAKRVGSILTRGFGLQILINSYNWMHLSL
jgi:hypothetical protein